MVVKMECQAAGGSKGRMKFVQNTTWNPYPNSKTFTIDPTHSYQLSASNQGGLEMEYIIDDGVMYEDKYVPGTYPITASLSGTTLTVSAQPNLNTSASLREYEYV